jgi:hypothetical protein
MVFLAPNTLLYPLSTRKKFKKKISALNIMILQMVRNQYVRFSWHVEIQVSSKILQLELPKKTLILCNLPCFQEGLFWGSFGLNVALGV